MFEITRSPFGKFEKIDCSDPETGHGFSLAPSPGATLLSLRFFGIEMLDGYQTPDELAAYKWSKSAVLFPFPNRLKDGKFEFEGRSFSWPINNADTGNAIHGYLRERKFQVKKTTVSTDGASVVCRFSERGKFEPFPFPFRFEIKFSIKKNGRFEVAFSCKNTGPTAMPCGFGWHPYFKIGDSPADENILQLPDCQRVEIDSRMIPTGERTPFRLFKTKKSLAGKSLDTGFFYQKKGGWKIRLNAPAGQLLMKADGLKWPFFQVFTPPHRQSVALEPMSCNIDAFNNGDGLVRLESGAAWRGKFELFFEK